MIRYKIVSHKWILLLIAFWTISPGWGPPITATSLARAGENDDLTIPLDKRLRYDDLAAAAAELTEKTLRPPVALGTKKTEIMAKLGKPKETDGYGTELYKVSDATITLSYTTDDTGEVIVSGVEFRPKKAIVWSNWVLVALPSAPNTGKKRQPPVQLTTQIRIADIGNRRSMQITLIGNQQAVSFVSWGLVF
jgi:hypothetical protein